MPGPAITKDSMIRAILAMDVYQRVYNAGIKHTLDQPVGDNGSGLGLGSVTNVGG